ncbi:MAG: acyl-CoA dehydrogenase family protein [Thermoleophilia bacterium]
MAATTGTDIATAQDVLAAVEQLAPDIAARAGETEAARRVPRDILDGLVAAGVFRVVRPPALGGLGVPLPEALEVFGALARADAAVGWNATMGAGTFVDIASLPARPSTRCSGARPTPSRPACSAPPAP